MVLSPGSHPRYLCGNSWHNQTMTDPYEGSTIIIIICPSGQHGKQEISLKKIFGGSQILTINATKFAGLDEGATPLGPYSATRGFTW